MSLQVWLPFTKDLNNQGLNGELNLSIAGATENNNGKLGKCQKIESTNNLLINSDWGRNSFSYGCWIKLNKQEIQTLCNAKTYDATYSSSGGDILGYNSYGGMSIRWQTNNLYTDNKELKTISFFSTARSYDLDKTNSAYVYYVSPSYSIAFDTWIHVMLTYDINDHKEKFYINGNLYATGDLSRVQAGASGTSVQIGLNRATWYGGNGISLSIPMYINDVRIYDHCLSPKEVKEISKGLVFHLPMREGGQALATSYAYPTFNISYATSYWSHWNASGANGSYSQNSDTNYIYELSNSDYSHRVSNDSTATGNYLLYQEKLFAGGYRSFQAIIKESNGSPIDESICYPAWNGSTSLSTPNSKWTKIVDLGNGFYWCICEGINQTTSPTSANSHLVGIYVKPGYTIYVSEAYVEDGKQFCTLPFFKNPNLITSLKAGGQTTVSNLKVTTSGTNADTYFYFNLSEPLVSGETYTLSCVASNIPDGEYWGFPIANQNNTAITMAIYNGVNTYTFTANDTAANKLQIIMDDNYRGNAHVNQCVFDDWKLTKSNLIDDCSGYGNNARLNGSISYFKSEGRNGKSCKLMSTNVGTSTLAGASYLSAPLSLPQMSELTIAFWTNPETWSRGGMIAATTSLNGFPSDYTIVPFHNYDSYIRFTDINGNYKNINYNSFTTANEWHHYAFTFDGTTIRVYKDGVELTNIAQSFSAPTKLPAFYNLFIGLSHAGGVYRTTRSMWSDFRIYTTCLSEEDIKALYNVRGSIDNLGNTYAFEIKEE